MEENRILTGIIKKAETEAAEIVRKAEQSAVMKKQTLDTVLKRIKRETDEKISLKLGEIAMRTESSIESEKRRMKLKYRERINSEVKQLFLSRIEKMIGTAEYDDFLARLIAEGAVAVNDDEVAVNCSFKEKITAEILSAASEYIRTNTGREIRIKISDSAPLSHQGIVVQSSTERISYNNQIETRLRRFDEDIKGVISKWITE